MTIHPFPGRPAVEPQNAAAALPPGYVQQGHDIYAVNVDENGEPVPVRVCSSLRVLGRTSDTEGRFWSLVVEVRDQRGAWNRVVLPQAHLNGSVSKVVSALSDRGLTLPSDSKAKGRLIELLTHWPAPDHYVLVRRVGWTDETLQHFVLREDHVIGGGRVILAGGESAAADRRTKGDLDGWRREVAGRCIGNPILMFAVSLAFTGPLLQPLGMAGGGAHLRGVTSSGKSTALHAAVSVWGNPKVYASWRATANGLEGLAAASNDMLLALDELGRAGLSLFPRRQPVPAEEWSGPAGPRRLVRRRVLLHLGAGLVLDP